MKKFIKVQNLRCGGCANTITTKLSELKNISEVVVDVEESKVSFTIKEEDDAILVKNKLRTLGYPSIDEENNIGAKAKSLMSCATGKFSK